MFATTPLLLLLKHLAAPAPSSPIYLDGNGTTPLHPSVQKALLTSIVQHQSNPSTPTPSGRASKKIIIEATAKIASLFNPNGTVIFTGSGTESIHTAITLVLRLHKHNNLNKDPTKLPHIIASHLDHPGTYNTLLRLRDESLITLTLVHVDSTGTVPEQTLLAAIASNPPSLVTLLHAHNELGTVQSLSFIPSLKKQCPDCLVHLDASQSLTKTPHFPLAQADLITITGHKHGAPKGIAALYLSPAVLSLDLSIFKKYGGILLAGGGQNDGLRASTENVPYILALSKSLERIADFANSQKHNRGVCEAILEELGDVDFSVNCSSDRTGISNLLSLSFPPVYAKDLVQALQTRHNVTIAAGSACDASKGGVPTASRSLVNTPGLTEEQRLGTVRISCGWWNTEEEGRRAGRAIKMEVERLRLDIKARAEK